MGDLRGWLMAGAMLVGGAAWAAPGDMDDAKPALELLDPTSTGHACTARGGVCVIAGATATAAVEEPIASAPPSGKGKARGVANPVRTFARATVGAEPWTLELDAYLAKPAVRGNAVFLFYDLADPRAMAAHEVTMMQQRSVLPGRAVAARVRLSPDDGFASGHGYRVQIVQLIGGKEMVLAQGEFALK